MLSKKLLKLLGSLTKREFSRFGKFVASPYFNENESVVKLYKVIDKKLNANDISTIEKSDVWQEVFPKKKYKDIEMRRLCSDLTQLAELFLSIESLKKSGADQYFMTLKGLKEKSLYQHFNNKIKTKKRTSKDNSLDFYYDQMRIEILKHEFEDIISPQNNSLAYLSTANRHLDVYYWIQKLKFSCSALSYKSVRVLNVEIEITTAALQQLTTQYFFNNPVIQIYYKTVCLLQRKESEQTLSDLLELLLKHEEIFPAKELRQVYFYIQNFCAAEINNGKSSYLTKLFDVYRIMIERGILPGKETLKPGVYKNILTLGLLVQEFRWVEDFIQKYTSRLPVEHQDNALNYNLAKVYFYKKDYEKVIEQLREVEYRSLIYALGGKLLLMRTYFELKETRPLDSLIDSFRIYLRRNKLISKDVRQQYLNSLRFTKKLANVAPYDKKGLQKVKEQIIKCKALAAKQWLLEKIAEME